MATKMKNDKTTINIKIPKDIKRSLDEFSDIVGIPLSTMFNSYAKHLATTRKFIAEDKVYEPDEKTGKELRKVLSDYKKGINFKSLPVDEFLKRLESGKL